MHSFKLTTELCYGSEALAELAHFDACRVFIVTDAFMAETPFMAQIRHHLGNATVAVFSGVKPNPDVSAIANALHDYLAFGPDVLLTVGGGSPIDTAKAVRKMAIEQGHRLSKGFVVVPTTSGTGSEVSSFAVVTSKDQSKVPLTSPDMIADLALLDPQAVSTAPASLMADSGMDAVSHALEAYVAKGHNPFSDAFAEKSLRMLFHHLVDSVGDGSFDESAREDQHTAATMAGIAFQNAGLGIVHGLSHSIGSIFHIPHGRINAMLMPHVIAFNSGELKFGPDGLTPVAQRYAKLAFNIGLSASTQRNYVLALGEQIAQIRQALNMPATITKAGVNRSDFEQAIPDIAAHAVNDFCTTGNPVPVTEDQLRKILHKII